MFLSLETGSIVSMSPVTKIGSIDTHLVGGWSRLVKEDNTFVGFFCCCCLFVCLVWGPWGSEGIHSDLS